jgi:hypothetical protein
VLMPKLERPANFQGHRLAAKPKHKPKPTIGNIKKNAFASPVHFMIGITIEGSGEPISVQQITTNLRVLVRPDIDPSQIYVACEKLRKANCIHYEQKTSPKKNVKVSFWQLTECGRHELSVAKNFYQQLLAHQSKET